MLDRMKCALAAAIVALACAPASVLAQSGGNQTAETPAEPRIINRNRKRDRQARPDNPERAQRRAERKARRQAERKAGGAAAPNPYAPRKSERRVEPSSTPPPASPRPRAAERRRPPPAAAPAPQRERPRRAQNRNQRDRVARRAPQHRQQRERRRRRSYDRERRILGDIARGIAGSVIEPPPRRRRYHRRDYYYSEYGYARPRRLCRRLAYRCDIGFDRACWRWRRVCRSGRYY